MNQKIRILHIDDSMLDRQLVKVALEKESDEFEIVEADNREEFEKQLAADNFDLVLSDFNILGFDGLQVLQIVKEKNPDLPVIIVTGTGSEEVAIQSMKMGAADYVIKSVKHIMGLVPTVKTVLEHKKAQDERKLALVALTESEELFRTAFESAAIGVYLMSLDGKFISVNNTLCRMLAYSRKDLENMKISHVTHPDDVNIGNELNAKLLTGEIKSNIYEKRFIHIRGHIVWVSISTGIVHKQKNTPQYFVSYIQDITLRKRAEEKLLYAKNNAEESDRLKTTFLKNISQEIHTPINAIVGFSGLLTDPSLGNEERRNYIGIIVQSSNQLLSIINDIITLSTIEAGQEKVNLRKVNVNSILKNVYDQFINQAQKQNILFNFKTNLTHYDANILTDEKKIMQILFNLLSNALKFTKKGFIEFGYTVKDNELEFYVSDTGIGIPAEMHEEIFERFRQVEYSPLREAGGFGMGLSISKAFIELLGGSIRLTSALGKGSIFYFTIPLNK